MTARVVTVVVVAVVVLVGVVVELVGIVPVGVVLLRLLGVVVAIVFIAARALDGSLCVVSIGQRGWWRGQGCSCG
ncbi:MAG: hypothetical protein GEU79_05140 [Acidimicrobiia bacterium]|nr:hypothetical protein [Acidimicrobiia bacterium]